MWYKSDDKCLLHYKKSVRKGFVRQLNIIHVINDSSAMLTNTALWTEIIWDKLKLV